MRPALPALVEHDLEPADAKIVARDVLHAELRVAVKAQRGPATKDVRIGGAGCGFQVHLQDTFKTRRNVEDWPDRGSPGTSRRMFDMSYSKKKPTRIAEASG